MGRADQAARHGPWTRRSGYTERFGSARSAPVGVGDGGKDASAEATSCAADVGGPLVTPTQVVELARGADLQGCSFAPGRLSEHDARRVSAARVWSNDVADQREEGPVGTAAYRPTTTSVSAQAAPGASRHPARSAVHERWAILWVCVERAGQGAGCPWTVWLPVTERACRMARAACHASSWTLDRDPVVASLRCCGQSAKRKDTLRIDRSVSEASAPGGASRLRSGPCRAKGRRWR